MAEQEEVFDDVVEDGEEEMGPAAMKALRAKLKKAVAEKQEYLEGWQRARAELANTVRQFEDEKKTAKLNGVIKAVEALLPALVSLERAKDAGELPASFAGVERQIVSGFSALGIERIAPQVGDQFNPMQHDALREVPTDHAEKDHTIEAVLSSGYSIGDRVVQPAHVSVFVHR